MADKPSNYDRFRDLTPEFTRHQFHQQRMTKFGAQVRVDERVLDVGCNGGYLADYLPRPSTYVGIDPSELAVAGGRKRGLDLRVGSAEHLAFPNRSFDVVVLGFVLERVASPEAVLAEATRVAARLVLGDTPHEQGRWGRDHVRRSADDLRAFSEPALRKLLSNYGQVRSIDILTWDGPAMLSFALEMKR